MRHPLGERDLTTPRLLAITSLAVGLVMMPFSASVSQRALSSTVLHRQSFDPSGKSMEAFGPRPDAANVAVQRMLRSDHGSWADSRSSHRVLRSALIGFGIGAAVGFAIVGVQGRPQRDGPFGGASVLQLAGIGAAAGGTLGAVIGVVAATMSEATLTSLSRRRFVR